MTDRFTPGQQRALDEAVRRALASDDMEIAAGTACLVAPLFNIDHARASVKAVRFIRREFADLDGRCDLTFARAGEGDALRGGLRLFDCGIEVHNVAEADVGLGYAIYYPNLDFPQIYSVRLESRHLCIVSSK